MVSKIFPGLLGVYLLTVKLRWLGVRAPDVDAGRRLTDLYGLLLLAR